MSQTSFTCADVGSVMDTLFSTDGSGNVGYCVVEVTVQELPITLSSIIGASALCPGLNQVSYAVAKVENATSYKWTYSDNSVIINDNGKNMVSIDGITTGGTLSVAGVNACSTSPPSSMLIEITPPELCTLSDCSRVTTFIDNEILTLLGSQDLFKA